MDIIEEIKSVCGQLPDDCADALIAFARSLEREQIQAEIAVHPR